MPLVTAEKSMKEALVQLAMMRASVVLPTPGGPQKIMEDTWSVSIRRRSTLPGPNRCVCPTYSSSVAGRSRAASGCGTLRSNSEVCSISGASHCVLYIFIIPRRGAESSSLAAAGAGK